MEPRARLRAVPGREGDFNFSPGPLREHPGAAARTGRERPASAPGKFAWTLGGFPGGAPPRRRGVRRQTAGGVGILLFWEDLPGTLVHAGRAP